MTDWYSHFDPSEFAKAREVQENLLRPEAAENTASGRKPEKKTAKAGNRIISLHGRSGTAALKRA
jgi:hypothetical protein